MKDSPFILITGNQHKADLLRKWLDMPFEHRNVDLEEIQSLSLKLITADKARKAYDIVKKTVLVEDVSFVFDTMGRLPGPFIKWFLEDMGTEGLCKLANGLDDRHAHATIVYALYDGEEMYFFENTVHGTIAERPRGEFGFGWNSIFIPEGSDKTYAEMTDEELRPFSHRAPAVEKLREHLLK